MIIDADTHLIEPPDIFTSRLARKYHEQCPHIQEHTEKESAEFRNYTANCIGDNPAESLYGPVERAKVMDRHGINAAATFPTLGLTGPEVYREIPGADSEVQLAVVSAYNDWILSWNEAAPGRFICLAVLPYWDRDGAIREIERCAERGAKGIVMSGYPQNHGCPLLPDPYGNDVWAAAQANEMCVSLHASGGGFENRDERTQLLGTGLWGVWIQGNEYLNNAKSAVDIICSGVLHRYPKLRFSFIECGIGWVPFVLESLDSYWPVFEPWKDNPAVSRDVLPSEVFNRQCFVETMFERYHDNHPYGNTMFGTDYPHPKCLIDDKIPDLIDNRLAGLSTEQRDAVLSKNAIRCWNLKPEDIISDDQMATAAKTKVGVHE